MIATFKRIFQAYNGAEAGILAGAIAYTALFALFPIILVILSLIGLVLRDPGLMAEAEALLIGALPPAIAEEAAGAVRGTVQAASIFGLVSLIGLFWTGSALFNLLERAFNRIYGVPSRSFVRGRLMGFGMILLFTVLIVLSIIAGTFAQFAVDVVTAVLPDGLLGLLATAISLSIGLLTALLLFTAIYRVVPNTSLRVSDVWPGALFAAVVFLVLLQVFPLYVRYVVDFNRFGAAFGFLFLVLTWLWLLGQVFIVGAVLNAVLKPPGDISQQPAEAETRE